MAQDENFRETWDSGPPLSICPLRVFPHFFKKSEGRATSFFHLFYLLYSSSWSLGDSNNAENELQRRA